MKNWKDLLFECKEEFKLLDLLTLHPEEETKEEYTWKILEK